MPVDSTQLKQMYETVTGIKWTDEEGAKWLMQRYAELDIYFKRPVLTKSAHVTLSDKASWLAQQHCHLCYRDGPVHVIPLRIEPESYQALSSVNKAAFKTAVAERFAGKEYDYYKSHKVCIQVLFVCGSNRRVRDLDNMAKLLLDAVKEVVISDDRNVEHLSLTRLTHQEPEEYIYLRISGSFVNDHGDVAAPAMRHSWAGMPVLRIEDYIV